jgi:hypothetical protein
MWRWWPVLSALLSWSMILSELEPTKDCKESKVFISYRSNGGLVWGKEFCFHRAGRGVLPGLVWCREFCFHRAGRGGVLSEELWQILLLSL